MADIEDRKITDPVVRWVGNGMAAVAVTIFVLYILDYQLGWIDCWAFEWNDFATLVTGGIAAIAAMIIGTKQVAITREQVHIANRQGIIMDRQTQIQLLMLKNSMLDRRLSLYKDVMDYATLSHVPIDSDRNKLRSKALSGMQNANFVFNAAIADAMLKLILRVNNYLTNPLDEYDIPPLPSGMKLEGEALKDAKKEKIMAEMIAIGHLVKPFMQIDENYLGA
ncbi:MAG: hypothetical protein AABZ76_07510 [Pseudomonadota bacterium]|uniref:hypothetical protein n=1 Tax=Sphingobium yanoikuyae TaxID=13690 RepID=UPI003113F1BE